MRFQFSKSHSCQRVPTIGGKVPTFEPQEIVRIRFMVFVEVESWLFYAKVLGTCVESWVELFAWPNSQHMSQASPPKSIAMSASMPYLGLGTPCEVLRPNFQTLNHWDCTDWPQVTWDSELGTFVNRPWYKPKWCFEEKVPSISTHVHTWTFNTLNMIFNVTDYDCLAQY